MKAQADSKPVLEIIMEEIRGQKRKRSYDDLQI